MKSPAVRKHWLCWPQVGIRSAKATTNNHIIQETLLEPEQLTTQYSRETDSVPSDPEPKDKGRKHQPAEAKRKRTWADVRPRTRDNREDKERERNEQDLTIRRKENVCVVQASGYVWTVVTG